MKIIQFRYIKRWKIARKVFQKFKINILGLTGVRGKGQKPNREEH